MPTYVKFVLSSAVFQMIITEAGTGTTKQQELALSKVKQLWIPLPPIEEQLRIVAKLDDIMGNLERMDQAYTELSGSMLKHFKNLVLQQAISGQLVPQLDSEPAVEQIGPAPAEDEVPFALPEKWKWVLIKSIAKVVRGGSPRPISNYLTDANDPLGLNWVRIGDAPCGGKLITSCKERIKADGLSKTRLISKGSLILSNSMSYGRPYILGVDGCIHDGWLALSDFEKLIEVEFFYYVLLSSYSQQQFALKAQGTTVSNLNADRVRSLFIPLPPLEEQRRIVARIEELFGDVDKLLEWQQFA